MFRTQSSASELFRALSKPNGCGSSTGDPKTVAPTKCCNSLGSYRTLPRTKIVFSRYAAQSYSVLGTILYCSVLVCTIRTILYCSVLFCTVSNYSVCHSVLLCTALYYSVLLCTVSYYYSVSLLCMLLPCRSNVVDISNPPPLAPSADSHVTGHVTDLVALNLEVNTSALNINDRVTPEEDGRTTYDLRPRDFLDLLDNTPTADHNLGPQDTSLSSPPDWSTTPTRPRLFPHKLY